MILVLLCSVLLVELQYIGRSIPGIKVQVFEYEDKNIQNVNKNQLFINEILEKKSISFNFFAKNNEPEFLYSVSEKQNSHYFLQHLDKGPM